MYHQSSNWFHAFYYEGCTTNLLTLRSSHITGTPSPSGYVATPSPAGYANTPSPGGYVGTPSPMGYSPMTPGAPYTPQTPGTGMDHGSADWIATEIEVMIKDTHEDPALILHTGIVRNTSVSSHDSIHVFMIMAFQFLSNWSWLFTLTFVLRHGFGYGL